MRILAIRGENLASLEGPFAVDFREGPLGRAGLFAITGPTGAGKSTLLDALCLALFGTTPRIAAVPGRGHEVGRPSDASRLTNRDPRTLLRRGAGRGFAEVEFQGSDGRIYTARWSVRRARDRADGRFQQSDHQLRDEAGVAIGRTQTEVLREIQRRLGLDFDQFCRSVLLAQGDFAAFLCADEKKRAELLEAVTGTGIYRALSVAAHERLAQARKDREALLRERDARPILDAEGRAALERELGGREGALQAAREQLDRVLEARRWWDDRRKRAAEVTGAEEALRAAEAALAEAAPRREILAAREEVEPLRGQVAAADEALRRRDEARKERADAVADQLEARGRAAEANRVLEEARVSARAAAAAREAIAPQLREAERLDAALGTATRLAGEAEAAHRERAARAEAAREALETLRAEEARIASELEALERWLGQHAAWQPVASQWERWERALADAAQLAAARRPLEAERVSAETQVQRAREAVEARARSVQESASAVEQAEAAVRTAAAARIDDGGCLAGVRARLDIEVELARRLLELAREAGRVAADLHVAEARRADLEREGAAAEADHTAATAERARLEGELDLAQEAVRDATAVLDLADRRALLEEGRPCPLCGSERHPWAEGGAPAAATMVRKYRERVAALEASLRACERRIAASQAQRGACGKEAARLADEAMRLRERLATLRSAWSQGRAEAAVLPPSDEGGEETTDARRILPGEVEEAAGAVEAWNQTLEERRAQLRAREAQARAAEAAWEAARRTLDEARAVRDAAREAHHEAETELRTAEGALRELCAQVEAIDRDARRIRTELAEAFGGVEDIARRLSDDSAGFAAFARETVEELRRRADRRQELLGRRGELTGAIGPLARAVQEAEADAGRARTAWQERVEEVAELRRRRSALLDGVAVSEVEARLQVEAQRHAAAVEEARSKAELAGAAAEAAAARLSVAEAQLERETAEATARESALVEAAASLGLDVEAVRRRLLAPADETRRLREELDALERARAERATVLEERRRALLEHEGSDRPDVREDEVEALHVSAETARAEAEAAYHEVRAQLLADDEARARRAAFLPQIDRAEREVAKWERMHELIGSASGDKFQLFAQSLTLDALLENANAHLAELAPRYRLERAPGASLELQVIDRDLVDEVRSTNSLSGGETFLVSLALALGLSALSSRATRVESLFIDEGFGSLDPQTLDVALSTLDALQAAGRKVGLISHVPGMAERVGVQICVVPRGKGSSRVEVRVA